MPGYIPYLSLREARVFKKVKHTALLEQIRTVDKTRLLEKIGEVSVDEMNRITEALRVSIDV